MGRRLTTAEREELGHRAWELSALGYGHKQIGDEIGVNKNTITGLLEEQRSKRRAEWRNGDVESIMYYQALARSARERRLQYPKGSNAQNIVGLLNVEISARQNIDRIMGTHAPTRTELKGNFTHEYVDLSGASEETVREIEQYLASLDT